MTGVRDTHLIFLSSDPLLRFDPDTPTAEFGFVLYDLADFEALPDVRPRPDPDHIR